MRGRRPRRNEEPVTCGEGDQGAVEVDRESALQDVTNVAELASMRIAVTGRELDEPNLLRSLSIAFEANAGAALAPVD